MKELADFKNGIPREKQGSDARIFAELNLILRHFGKYRKKKGKIVCSAFRDQSLKTAKLFSVITYCEFMVKFAPC